jgi:hypothetical protein
MASFSRSSESQGYGDEEGADPYYISHSAPESSHALETGANFDGWVLYYSPEGYPYYYNEFTGESQWANYDEEDRGVEGQNQQDPDEELDRRDYQQYSPELQNYSDEEEESVGTEEYEELEFQEYLNSEYGRNAYEVRRIIKSH